VTPRPTTSTAPRPVASATYRDGAERDGASGAQSPPGGRAGSARPSGSGERDQ
jgi:hypothetical protein